MDLRRYSKLLILLASIQLIGVVDFSFGLGTLKVSFYSFVYDTSMERCDLSDHASARGCDARFQILLTQDKTGDLLDFKQRNNYTDTDVVFFEDQIATQDNPIKRLLTSNTGKVKLWVNIFDAEEKSETLIFEMKIDLKTTQKSAEVSIRVTNRFTSLTFGYTFECAVNHYGELCSNFCEPHDDTNGAHYTCDYQGNKLCMKGWMGANCDVKIECKGNVSLLCKNGGICEHLSGSSYKCKCPKGFSGMYCETPTVAQCLSVDCQNGGTCEAVDTGYKCLCRTGFVGKHCETDKIRCTADTCKGGSVCKEYVGGFECLCKPGYSGLKCDEDLDECSSSNGNPCINGGTCKNTDGGFSCLCPKGLTGNLCQNNVDECTEQTPKPDCGKGNYCVNTPKAFACAPVDLDDCAGGEKCYNGGECVDKQQHFVCLCRTGFNGATCNETATTKTLNES